MLPSEFKEQMGELADEGFVLRPSLFENSTCLDLFTRKDWDLQQEKLRETFSIYDEEGIIRNAKEVYEAVKRGDLSGMSFAFTVPDGGDTYDAKTNTRTIRQIAKVYECSVVPYPAYPTTSIEARSERAIATARLEARQRAKILYNQIMKARV